MKISFEEAKDVIAKKWGSRTWEEIDWYALDYSFHEDEWYESIGCMQSLLEKQAAELIANEAVKAIFQFQPADEWHEDMGDALWYTVPIHEPPYIGSPNKSDWTEDYYTHFLPLNRLALPDEQGNPMSAFMGNPNAYLPYPELEIKTSEKP